jgi:signal transduction histidine kinase
LEQALKERQQAFTVVVHELRTVLQAVSQSQGGAGGLHDLQVFVRQLLEYAEISGQDRNEHREVFDPRVLFSALVATYRPLIDAKGLRLFTDCTSAPGTVIGDSSKIRRIAEILLNSAVRTTRSGHIAFAFSFPDEARWVISVSDTGTGLSSEASQRLFSGSAATADSLPHYGIGFAVAKALVLLLGGTLNTETRSSMGTRFVVVLPRIH